MFNGSLISVFFLDNSFHFEEEDDIFINKFSLKKIKKSKKVIEEATNIQFENINKTFQIELVDNFFVEFLKK